MRELRILINLTIARSWYLHLTTIAKITHREKLNYLNQNYFRSLPSELLLFTRNNVPPYQPLPVVHEQNPVAKNIPSRKAVAPGSPCPPPNVENEVVFFSDNRWSAWSKHTNNYGGRMEAASFPVARPEGIGRCITR